MTRLRTTAVIDELAAHLHEQRKLVEYLLFKLVEARLLLSSNQASFVPIAMAEIESVLEGIRNAEYRREALLDRLSSDWNVPTSQLTLSYIAERVPEPYDEIFADHRDGFMTLVDKVEDVTRDNQRLATAGLGRVRSALSGLVDDTPTYGREGRIEPVESQPLSHDRVI